MPSLRTLILDEDHCVADKLKGTEWLALQVDQASTFAQFRKSAAKHLPDVLLLHETQKLSGIQLVAELRKLDASVPVIVLAHATSGMWQAALNNSMLDVISSGAGKREIEVRIAKITGQRP